MRARPLLICPKCRSDSCVPIVYGYPSRELLDMFWQGLVMIGGCFVDGHESLWECLACGHRWGSSLNDQERALSGAVWDHLQQNKIEREPDRE